MDVETRKPFACKSSGCSMSFTNEDHLTVHEKKHEMVLNLCLGNKSSTAFPADQTPTPTRLIKNCEEVGLFDDLKHVNPFDETFRRAVESNSNANTPNSDSSNAKNTLSENLLASQESLHTPQVFPNVESQDDITITTTTHDEFKVEKKKLTLQTNFASKQRRTTSEKHIKILNNNNNNNNSSSNNNNNNNKRSLPKKTIPRSKNLRLVAPKQQSIIIPDNNKYIISKPIFIPNTINIVQPSHIIMSGGLPLPASTLDKTRPLILPKILKPDSNINISPPEIPVKEKLKAVLSGSKLLRTNSNTNNNSPSPQTVTKIKETNLIKKVSKEKSSVMKTEYIYDKDCMERRRAAASRYRRKVKREQIDLIKRNNELAQENVQLKNEVKQLKQLLLVHQNCDVSRAIPLGLNVHLTAAPAYISSPAAISGVQFFINMPKTTSIGSNTEQLSNVQKTIIDQ